MNPKFCRVQLVFWRRDSQTNDQTHYFLVFFLLAPSVFFGSASAPATSSFFFSFKLPVSVAVSGASAFSRCGVPV